MSGASTIPDLAELLSVSPAAGGVSMPEASNLPSIVLTATGGALRNGYIHIRGHESFFPPDAIGGRKKHEPGRTIMLHFAGTDETVETDIDPKRLIRLGREGLVKAFFRFHGIREGGRFRVARVADREYRLEPVRTTSPARIGARQQRESATDAAHPFHLLGRSR